MTENTEKAKDIFQQIRDSAQERADNLKELIFKNKERKEKKQRNEYLENLKVLAEECRSLFSDVRYPQMQKFLSESKKNLIDNLIRINTNSKIKEEQILLSARIAAQIELLELLLNRPSKIVDEFEKVKENALWKL